MLENTVKESVIFSGVKKELFHGKLKIGKLNYIYPFSGVSE